MRREKIGVVSKEERKSDKDKSTRLAERQSEE